MKIPGAMRFYGAVIGLCLIVPISAFAQTTDPSVRLDRLEALVRQMTGQIDDLTHQVQVLQQTVDGLQQVLGGMDGDTGIPAPATLPPGTVTPEGTTAPATPALQLNLDPAALGAPPADLGTLPATAQPAGTIPGVGQPATGQPLDLGQLILNGGAPTTLAGAATPTMTGDSRADYDRAYQSILNGDYADAEQSFRAFIAYYPTDPLAVDAQYWVAESLFSREMYGDAVPEYLTAYRANPSSDLAPTALYKLGLSYLALQQNPSACASFAQVIQDYPGASNALLQSVTTAQASAGC